MVCTCEGLTCSDLSKLDVPAHIVHDLSQQRLYSCKTAIDIDGSIFLEDSHSDMVPVVVVEIKVTQRESADPQASGIWEIREGYGRRADSHSVVHNRAICASSFSNECTVRGEKE